MNTDLSLIIFDCDGTIADSQHMIAAAMNMAFDSHKLVAPDHEDIRSIVGLSLVEAMKSLLREEYDADPQALAQSYKESFQELVADKSSAEPLYEGAHETLHGLGLEARILLGIATGKSQRGVSRLLKQNRLGRLFSTIQTADDAPSKPHPAMIQQAMAATGIEAYRTVMVGDTTYDMEMAVNAGVYPLGVAWGYHSVDKLTRAGAKYIAKDYRDLDAHMRKIHLS